MITVQDVLRVFPGAKIMKQPEPIGNIAQSLMEMFNQEKKGQNSMIITITAVNKTPRMFKGQQQYGVITKEYGEKNWVTLECGFEPQKNQQFDVLVDEKPNPNGGLWRNAKIVGPAPAAHPATQGRYIPDGYNEAPMTATKVTPQQPPLPQSPPVPPAGQPRPAVPTGLIPWSSWVSTISAAWAVVVANGIPSAEAVAVINTTLIALEDGKLEPPPEQREPGSDDNDVITW